MINKVLLTIIFIVFSTSQSYAEWKVTTSIDEMTGKKSAYAISDAVKPTKQMGFPYQDVVARIGVGCEGGDSWSYINFSKTPNITNKKAKKGYSLIKTRIKWDDTVESTEFTQKFGSDSLFFGEHLRAIRKLSEANTLLVELDWYHQGPTYFRFSLQGSSKALSRIEKICAGN